MTKNLFKYVGLGVKIIFHPLASELDRLLSRKMKFKFGKLLLLGVVLSFIVTSTLCRCFIEQLNANVVACTAYQHSPVKFNAHYLVMFRYEIIYNIQYQANPENSFWFQDWNLQPIQDLVRGCPTSDCAFPCHN